MRTPVPTFVSEDLNFIEKSSNSTSSSRALPPKEFLDTWEAFKTHFGVVDVEHDAHTYFHINPLDPTSRYSWSSRLDRFLALASVCTNPLFDPVVDIPHHTTNTPSGPPALPFQTTSPSDCLFVTAPVVLLVGPPSLPGSPSPPPLKRPFVKTGSPVWRKPL